MRSKLTELGFDAPNRRYGFEDNVGGNANDDTGAPEHDDDGYARGVSMSSKPQPRRIHVVLVDWS
jgi:hypothetical protein